jgi:hypothetical protein
MGLCKYRHIFGREGEGAHSLRLFNVAIVDVIATLIAGALLGRGNLKRFLAITLGLFLLGVIAHRLFCVNTTVNKAIFGLV